MNWGQCSSWGGFAAEPLMNMDFSSDPCDLAEEFVIDVGALGSTLRTGSNCHDDNDSTTKRTRRRRRRRTTMNFMMIIAIIMTSCPQLICMAMMMMMMMMMMDDG